MTNAKAPVFCLPNFFRSTWFLWQTIAFISVFALDIFILAKHYADLPEQLATIFVLIIGVFMIIFPYRTFYRACIELEQICQSIDSLDQEPKKHVISIALVAQQYISTASSRYLTAVLMILLLLEHHMH
jgi:hypothetical protein